MQLRNARLCLDCEEVHDAQRCPACASETFAYLSRWVAVPDTPGLPRPPKPDTSVDRGRLDAVRGLTKGHVVTGGVLGITTLGVLGWWWRRGSARRVEQDRAEEPAALRVAGE